MDFPPINPGLGYFRESFSRDSPDAIDGYVGPYSEPYWMPEEFYSPNPNNPPTFPEASIVFVPSGYDNHPAVSGGYLMDTASAPYQAFGFNAKFIPGPFLDPSTLQSNVLRSGTPLLHTRGLLDTSKDMSYFGVSFGVASAFMYMSIPPQQYVALAIETQGMSQEDTWAYVYSRVGDLYGELVYFTSAIRGFLYSTEEQITHDINQLNNIGATFGRPSLGTESYVGVQVGDLLWGRMTNVNLTVTKNQGIDNPNRLVLISASIAQPSVYVAKNPPAFFEAELVQYCSGPKLYTKAEVDIGSFVVEFRGMQNYSGEYGGVVAEGVVPEGTPVDIAEVYSAMGYSRDRKMFPFYFLVSLGYLFVAPGHKIDFWNGGFRSESGGFRRGKMGLG